MSWLGRNLSDVIILDNSPISYLFQPECGMPIVNWYDDPNDTELTKYIPILEWLAFVEDVRTYIPWMVVNNQIDYKRAIETVRNATFIFDKDSKPQNPKTWSRSSMPKKDHSWSWHA